MSKSEKPSTQTNQSQLPQSDQTRFISAYGQKRKVSVTFKGQGRTKQQFKEECDINKIMARFQQTGLIEFVNKNQGQYLDCTGFDYQEAMQTVAAANSMFMQMPSALRAEFGNSPQKFVEFCENPDNRSRLAEMGLLRDEAQKQGGSPTQAPAAQPTPPASNPSPIPAAGSDAPGT